MPDNSSPALMAPTGRLDAGNSRAFEIEVVEVINNSPQGMVMDFAELGYVSSAGLRVILLAAKKLKAGGGKFVLCGLNPSVEEVFKISGFLKILNVTPDRATAMAQFS